MSKKENPDIIDMGKIYHNKDEIEYIDEKLNNLSNGCSLSPEQYSDICVKCQQRHYNSKGFDKEGNFPVDCKGIPKRLDEEGYYPLEDVYGEEYDKLTIKEKVQLQLKNNPLLWAEKMLNWTPYNDKREFYQWYQKEMMLCTSLRIAGRLGRRMGKSEVIVVKALHFGMTCLIKNPQILIIAPFMNLCDELHQRMINKLDESAFSGIYSSTKKPYVITIPRTEFGDFLTIKLFTTGSGSGNAGASTRGQRADMLINDECGYTDQESLEAIMPLALESKEVPFLVTSTPSQVPNTFKEWCLKDNEWKDFYYPFTIMPDFKSGNKEYEQFKKMYSIKGWKQEIEAEFFEGSAKVFKEDDIIASLREFRYPEDISDLHPTEQEDWRFVIGVDWNAAKHGVQIVLQGINLITRRTKVWKRISITNDKRELQTRAIKEIIELDRRFNAEKIVVDNGYGAVQIELLVKHYSMYSQEDKIVPVDFASTLIQEHPLTKEKYSKRMKAIMVAMLEQRFEYRTIEISSIEEGDLKGEDRAGRYLTTQLNYYEIEKYDGRSNPVFKASGPGTDHALDALLLSNYGINKYIEEVFDMEIGERASGGRQEIDKLFDLIDEESTLRKKFTNNSLRENFTEVYSKKAMDEEEKNIMNNKYSRRLNKVFGTTTKRLSRRSF